MYLIRCVRGDADLLLFRPRLALSLYIFLRFDTFPDFAMKTAQVFAVVAWFGHEYDMTVAYFYEKVIAVLDLKFLPHCGGNSDLMLVVYLDPECHDVPHAHII